MSRKILKSIMINALAFHFWQPPSSPIKCSSIIVISLEEKSNRWAMSLMKINFGFLEFSHI